MVGKIDTMKNLTRMVTLEIVAWSSLQIKRGPII